MLPSRLFLIGYCGIFIKAAQQSQFEIGEAAAPAGAVKTLLTARTRGVFGEIVFYDQAENQATSPDR